MQIRIRSPFRAALETVQRATHAFAASIEDMGVGRRGFGIIVPQEFPHSVPVGAPQTTGTPEGLGLRLREIRVKSPLVVYGAGTGFAREKECRGSRGPPGRRPWSQWLIAHSGFPIVDVGRQHLRVSDLRNCTEFDNTYNIADFDQAE